jgi:predicted solute-binding protein
VGSADVGIAPVVEVARQGLVAIPGTGIACRGAVRSILLVCRTGPERVRTIATDAGSRTSVLLSQVVLRRRFGVSAQVFSIAPDLEAMLAQADAALLIGDAALRVDPDRLPYAVLDLGAEWLNLTGLPMVFALWAGHSEGVRSMIASGAEEAFRGSLDYGLSQMDSIVAAESAARGFAPELVRRYLTRHIVFEIGVEEQRGLERFLQEAEQTTGLARLEQTAQV